MNTISELFACLNHHTTERLVSTADSFFYFFNFSSLESIEIFDFLERWAAFVKSKFYQPWNSSSNIIRKHKFFLGWKITQKEKNNSQFIQSEITFISDN